MVPLKSIFLHTVQIANLQHNRRSLQGKKWIVWLGSVALHGHGLELNYKEIQKQLKEIFIYPTYGYIQEFVALRGGDGHSFGSLKRAWVNL